jgi:hypothetical protein
MLYPSDATTFVGLRVAAVGVDVDDVWTCDWDGAEGDWDGILGDKDGVVGDRVVGALEVGLTKLGDSVVGLLVVGVAVVASTVPFGELVGSEGLFVGRTGAPVTDGAVGRFVGIEGDFVNGLFVVGVFNIGTGWLVGNEVVGGREGRLVGGGGVGTAQKGQNLLGILVFVFCVGASVLAGASVVPPDGNGVGVFSVIDVLVAGEGVELQSPSSKSHVLTLHPGSQTPSPIHDVSQVELHIAGCCALLKVITTITAAVRKSCKWNSSNMKGLVKCKWSIFEWFRERLPHRPRFEFTLLVLCLWKSGLDLFGHGVMDHGAGCWENGWVGRWCWRRQFFARLRNRPTRIAK